MNMNRPRERRRQAAEQAAEWLVALRSDKLSGKERSEYLEWLRESPLHIAEMLRVSQVDQALAECTLWSECAAAEDCTNHNVVSLHELKDAMPRREANGFSLLRWGSAAGLAALAILGTWLFIGQDQLVVRTQVGERRVLTLADGSTVDVAPATELRVRLEKKQRLIFLKRGQAYFHVAKNPIRPFIVNAGQTSVRAVGTAFDVSRGTSGITVTVVEGRVAVIREHTNFERLVEQQPPRTADVLLRANEQAVVTPSAEKVPVRKVNGAAEVAWTDGTLIFNNEPLVEVVRRFNTYNYQQIQILDRALAMRRVTGVFKASDPESLIAFVRLMAGEPHTQDGLIRLVESAN